MKSQSKGREGRGREGGEERKLLSVERTPAKAAESSHAERTIILRERRQLPSQLSLVNLGINEPTLREATQFVQDPTATNSHTKM